MRINKALECKPKLIICGASAHPRDINYKKFREICDKVGAIMWADVAHGFGLKIAGVNNSPFPYADIVSASASKSMRGPRVGVIYSKKKYAAGIDHAVFPGILGAPQNSNIASLAIAFKYCSTPQYIEYAERVVANCKALADELMKLGNHIVTDGTDTNIMLWDIKPYNINARTMLDLGDACNIQFNGHSLISDKISKHDGQGSVRFGTNVVTARDYHPEDMRQVARFLNELAHIGSSIQKSESVIWEESLRIQEIAEEVENFAIKFPLPGITTKNIF